MTAVNGVYTAMWNNYLEDGLKFTSTSSFTDLNDQAFANWDFGHIDPTGAQKGNDVDGNIVLYTAGDLAAVMALNVDLKVLVRQRLLRLRDPVLPDDDRPAAHAAE